MLLPKLTLNYHYLTTKNYIGHIISVPSRAVLAAFTLSCWAFFLDAWHIYARVGFFGPETYFLGITMTSSKIKQNFVMWGKCEIMWFSGRLIYQKKAEDLLFNMNRANFFKVDVWEIILDLKLNAAGEKWTLLILNLLKTKYFVCFFIEWWLIQKRYSRGISII